MSSVRITTLANGLRVATDTMPHVETVSVGAWVGVGARHERPQVNGVAHFIEHMMFKGTPKRSAFAISEQIETVGGQMNAYTTREHTAYFAKVLGEDVALAVDIIADMLQNAELDETELSRERTVILQEIGQAADTPDDIVFDHFQAVAYPDQPLGRPVLGSIETVGALDRPILVDYLARHYGASGMVLAASGKIAHDQLVEIAERLFTNLPAEADMSQEPARYAGGDFREARDLEQLHLILGFDGVAVHDPEFYAYSVLSTLLGGGMSSRLFQEIRERRGLAYSIYSFGGTYRDGGLFGVYAGTGGTDAMELVPVLADQINSVAGTVTESEVARAKAQLRAGTLMALESTTARCEQLGQQLLVFGRSVPTTEIIEKIEAVDVSAVRRCAERLLRSKPTVAALGQIEHLESYPSIAARLG